MAHLVTRPAGLLSGHRLGTVRRRRRTPQSPPAVARPEAREAPTRSPQPAVSRTAPGVSLTRRHGRQHEKSVQTAAAAANAAAATDEPSAGTSTFLQAVLNVMNILMGVGLLSIPFALNKAGWMGLAVLGLLGVITNYSGKALVEAHSVVKKETGKANVGYEDIAEAALGPIGRSIVSAIMYVELFGTCALLFILQGDNLTNLFGASVFSSKKIAMICAACVMVPTVWLPDVTALSYLGFLGVTATFSVVGSVIFTFLSGGYVAGAATSLVNPQTLPLTFGIMAFVFAGHGVFPSIQAAMKRPEDFPKVLNTAYLVVGTFCALIGALGYYMYGSNVADVIIFSLPKGPLALICSCLILINPLTKYALTLEPVAAAVERSASKSALPAILRRIAIRTLLAAGTLLSAMYVPYLAMVMSLIGSVLTISVSVVLPAVLHMILCHNREGATTFPKLWDYICIVMGAICALSGTCAALQGLAAAVAAGA